MVKITGIAIGVTNNSSYLLYIYLLSNRNVSMAFVVVVVLYESGKNQETDELVCLQRRRITMQDENLGFFF